MTGEEICKPTGKIRYATAAKAKASLGAVAKSKPKFDRTKIQDVYRCSCCKGYHVSRLHRKDMKRRFRTP